MDVDLRSRDGDGRIGLVLKRGATLGALGISRREMGIAHDLEDTDAVGMLIKGCARCRVLDIDTSRLQYQRKSRGVKKEKEPHRARKSQAH